MDKPPLDITILELLASRICHDLISPVGAVHNGVEFMQEMGAEAGGEEAVSLIAHSAQMASARLQAFRLAYGAAGRDPNIKPEDVHTTFDDLVKADGKIKQEWDPHGPLGFDGEKPLGYCKMLMGTLMLAQECLPKGGKITVSAGNGTQTEIVAHGETLVREQVDEALNRTISVDSLDPRLVHPFAVSLLANHYGFDIEIAENNSELVKLTLTYRRADS